MRGKLIATLFFTWSLTANAVTPTEKLPPDYFRRSPNGGEEFLFPTKLEKACPASQNRSKFCPNYGGADGMPSDWVMARYKSRHAGGFDTGTSSLLMVYVPPGAKVGGSVERARVHRWLNFAIPTDPPGVDAQPTPMQPIPKTYNSSMPRTFTMVSLTEGNPANVHFQKFQRIGDRDYYTPERESDPRTCYTCHPNGLREISPLGYHVDAVEAADPLKMLDDPTWRAVQKINKAMESSAGSRAVKWDNGFDPKVVFKKVIGPTTPADPRTRTKEYILGTGTAEECARGGSLAQCGCARIQGTYNLKDIFNRAPGAKNVYTMAPNANLDWQKIASAMDCQMCHDHSGRGAITEGTGPAQINFKLLVDQSMPNGSHSNPLDGGYSNDLDTNHRIALANCLRKEFEDSRSSN